MKHYFKDWKFRVCRHNHYPWRRTVGYRVNAGGDIKNFGLVKAAPIPAGRSIYITKGIAGQGKGTLKAGGNIRVGDMNG